MRLHTKILSSVIGIISILTAVSAYIEVRRQMAENERLEDEFQSIQAANAVSVFEMALWQIDDVSAEAGLHGLFQSSSPKRAQVVTPHGEIFVGLKSKELEASGSKILGISTEDKTTAEPEIDKDLMLPIEKLQQPIKTYSKIPFEKLHKENISGSMSRMTAALWYRPDATSDPRFVGHLIIEYSLEKAFARARLNMFRYISANLITGTLMVLLLVLATNKAVISPIDILSKASRKIAEGDFNATVSVSSRDEIGQLAKDFDEMRVKVKDFTNNLQNMVEQRTYEVIEGKKKIQKILIHIEQGILTFDTDYRIDSEFSNFLMRFLGVTKEEIAGADIFKLILDKIEISDNDRDQLASSILNILNEEEVTFELNSHHLIKEAVINLKDKKAIAGFEWAPITDENTNKVIKIMLSIKDLTMQRELERTLAEEQKTNSAIMRHISDAIRVGRSKIEFILSDAKVRLARIYESLSSAEGGNPNGIFVDLHTIKGNARTYGLKNLIEKTHLTESYVAKWRAHESYDRNMFLAALDSMKKEVYLFSSTLTDVMGDIEKSNGTHGQIASFFNTASTIIYSILKSHAEQGIHLKSATISDSVCDWDEKMLHAIGDILVHAITNSVDHGYLLPLKNGEKIDDVEIELSTRIYGEMVVIEVTDRGSGVSAEKARDIARKCNIPFDENDPFEILFHCGTSTSDNITTSSGRGVGLTAIRKIAQSIHGDVAIHPSLPRGTTLAISIPRENAMKHRPATSETKNQKQDEKKTA
ncbi:MAG: HAMP domain-containing protein [Oligoflexales bacterium]|nr:HAMP domain-containing protein [Oligoflexales bacterium]